MKLFDRGRLPRPVQDDLTAHLAGEGARSPRILAWGTGDGGFAVGLVDRLMVGRAGDWTGVGWHEIERGGWDEASSTLRWRTMGDHGHERSVTLTDPGRLPELFRERVEQTIVMQRTVNLTPTKTATIAARRSLADGASEIVWTVTAGRGVNLNNPDLATRARAEVERVQADWSL